MSASTGRILNFRPRQPARAQPPPELHSRELVLEWFETHRAALLRYARRVLPGSESPEDLVQDVFCRLLQHPDPGSLRNPRAFLMAAARNAAIDLIRKQRPQSGVEPDRIGQAPGPLDEAELMTAIGRALDSMPERCREVFVLRRFRDLDTPTVARRLGISKRMVQKHVAAALEHLERHLRTPE